MLKYRAMSIGIRLLSWAGVFKEVTTYSNDEGHLLALHFSRDEATLLRSCEELISSDREKTT